MIINEIKGGVTSAIGFKAGVAKTGIKEKAIFDLALIYSEMPAVAAGVFTRNSFQAAPVMISRKHIASGKACGFIVNSGCANACTGEQGLNDAELMAEKSAEKLGCNKEEILVASTGVIGKNLAMDRIVKGIETASLNLSSDNGDKAAKAIMTTDTVAKEYAVTLEIDGKVITIGGMAKGSGMIHPNMATMLGFITTDASISAQCLQSSLSKANENSFNMISVDGDTSTNDSLFVLANGMAGNKEIDDEKSEDFQIFKEALNKVCTELAIMIAKDGEGATKLITVNVINAETKKDAALGAKAIACSNLVKCAVFGKDANWGRIICALGYSGAQFDPWIVDVYLGDLIVAQNGGGLDFNEEKALDILEEDSIVLTVDLKNGREKATAWGCDMSYDYVKINADYRT